MEKIFNKSLEVRLLDKVPTSIRKDIVELDRQGFLKKSLESGSFGNWTDLIKLIFNKHLTHRKIFSLIREIQKVLPQQFYLDKEQPKFPEELIGTYYIKGFGFQRWGGRGTAAPSENQKAREILDAVQRGETTAVAVAPIKNQLSHPLLPDHPVEIRTWEINLSEDEVDKVGKDVAPFARHIHYVRVRPGNIEKVTLAKGSGGGETVILVD